MFQDTYKLEVIIFQIFQKYKIIFFYRKRNK